MRVVNYRDKKVEIEKLQTKDTTENEVYLSNISDFDNENYKHIQNVKKALEILAYCLIDAGNNHDFTKIQEPYRTMMYLDKYNSIIQDMSFSNSGWINSHRKLERYHIENKDDVDLIDIIEMICNKVINEKCITGKNKINIDFDDTELLLKSFKNTVDLVNEITEIKIEEPGKSN